jgi:hypothetical protein
MLAGLALLAYSSTGRLDMRTTLSLTLFLLLSIQEMKQMTPIRLQLISLS